MDSVIDILTTRRAQALACLLEQPLTQEALRQRLEDVEGVDIHPGSMTPLVRPLLERGLVARATPRGPLAVPHADLVRRVLRSAFELDAALASAARLEQGREEARALRAAAALGGPVIDAHRHRPS